MSTILFDSTRVNPVRKPFGLGIAFAKPVRRAPYTQADLDWWAQESNQNATDYEVIEPARDWDREAGEAEAQARLDAGLSLF
jgi:hypothetical protein